MERVSCIYSPPWVSILNWYVCGSFGASLFTGLVDWSGLDWRSKVTHIFISFSNELQSVVDDRGILYFLCFSKRLEFITLLVGDK